MIAEYSAGELVTLIAAVAAGVGSIIGAWRANQVKHVAEKVHSEVKTMNGLRLGELADDAETRRIEVIPRKDRTAAEQSHVEHVPPPPDT